ncbi:hypothetical protein BM536_012375 [Streptomyces phaeoluteigriseus]|uniref:DUF262 domain-containing protein n=1 Tax=Streptomyces phaeoluteigriseus TaxID=114686 RepID=A0A1V6MSF4_9ACTN|nr:DUF262 domain-containing protein [Streptomyces phaeoluteigriseus]OQD55389.1 hypothetical protein BM536_012375 [Streptomyces phaeoluteigriseus]
MRADTVDLRRIFGRDIRYTVPLFQRPYVWNRDDNWSALWEDIRRTVERAEQAALTGDTVAPHFLGAVVFGETPYLSSSLETRQVIDGQQRLTTLQLFLFAARLSAAALNHERSVRLLSKFLENDEDLFDRVQHPDHLYKVWPTNADRDEFRTVMRGQGGAGRFAEAITYFKQEIDAWLAEAAEPEERLGALVQTLREQLRLVIIDLEKHDDAQVVFETLNSRGTPLEHADLIKNLLFRDAERAGADIDRLYKTYWAPFDQDEWRTEQTTGRITRSRLDVFLTYWLTMRTQREFTASALFKEFERWLLSAAVPTEEVFAELARYAEIYDLIDDYPQHGVEGRFLYRMKVFQTSTPMPLLLLLYGLDESVLPPERRRRAIRAIDSYLVRRALLNLSNRDHNNVFRDLVAAAARQPDRADEAVIKALSAMQGAHRHWPSDHEFRASLEQDPIYTRLYRRGVRILLEALEDELRTDHTEQLVVPLGEQAGAKLTIEHVMPQSWRDNWPPLENDPSEGSDRDELVHTLGNLTLVTARLNPTLGNMAWEDKRQWLSKHSLLRLTHGTLLSAPPNTDISDWAATWDEHRIHARGSYLGSLSLNIWPHADGLLAAPVSADRGDK